MHARREITNRELIALSDDLSPLFATDVSMPRKSVVIHVFTYEEDELPLSVPKDEVLSEIKRVDKEVYEQMSAKIWNHNLLKVLKHFRSKPLAEPVIKTLLGIAKTNNEVLPDNCVLELIQFELETLKRMRIIAENKNFLSATNIIKLIEQLSTLEADHRLSQSPKEPLSSNPRRKRLIKHVEKRTPDQDLVVCNRLLELVIKALPEFEQKDLEEQIELNYKIACALRGNPYALYRSSDYSQEGFLSCLMGLKESNRKRLREHQNLVATNKDQPQNMVKLLAVCRLLQENLQDVVPTLSTLEFSSDKHQGSKGVSPSLLRFTEDLKKRKVAAEESTSPKLRT